MHISHDTKEVAGYLWENYDLIYCCGIYHQPNLSNNFDRKIKLFDNDKYENRFLEIIRCPKCNKVKALVTQWEIKSGKLKELKPKKGKLEQFIKYYEHEPYEEIKLKSPETGAFSNMYWYYIDGFIDNIIRDLNDTKIESFNSELKILKLEN